MTKENKLALAIVVAGAVFIAGYRYYKHSRLQMHSVPSPQAKEEIVLPRFDSSVYRRIPEVRRYLDALKRSISAGEPFLPLPDEALDEKQRIVQKLLMRDKRFNADAVVDGKRTHNEMMRIVPAIRSVLDDALAKRCKNTRCYQAEKYNFATNTTVRAIVDPGNAEVLRVERYAQMQPDISKRLQHIAEAIALQAPEVREKLGFVPKRKDITMANVRGSMKESPCEDTTHLCVAPTFADQRKGRALWAVVDLTALRLAAAKWAPLGKTTTPACIDERVLQNRYIMEHFCNKDTVLEKDGWHIVYRLTGSDGLEIRQVFFHGKAVLRSAKIVDWHVAYAQTGATRAPDTPVYVEGRRVEFVKTDDDRYLFGYNDAMGCPMFSTSVVLPFGAPQIRDLPNGFALIQDFRNPKWPMACNYRYENRFEFYLDGSFRIIGTNKGRGCASHAIYRPVMRIDFALNKERFYRKVPEGWHRIAKEISERVEASERFAYKIEGESGAYALEPNHGQFGDHSRGDHATIFVTRFHKNEGDEDFLTLGSCCKLEEDGPERFVNDENLSDTDIVVWYVPRIRNDDRPGHEYCWADSYIDEEGNLGVKVWPCSVGPKFVPIEKGTK